MVITSRAGMGADARRQNDVHERATVTGPAGIVTCVLITRHYNSQRWTGLNSSLLIQNNSDVSRT